MLPPSYCLLYASVNVQNPTSTVHFLPILSMTQKSPNVKTSGIKEQMNNLGEYYRDSPLLFLTFMQSSSATSRSL